MYSSALLMLMPCECVCLQRITFLVIKHPRLAISRLSDLPRKFRRFAELFGNIRKCHEVDRNCLYDFRKMFGKYAVDLPKICQSLGLSVIFQIYIKTAEIYISN